MLRETSSFRVQFLVGRPVVIFETNRTLKVEIILFDIAGIGLDAQAFPSRRKRAVLSPLHVQPRPLAVTMGVLDSSGWAQHPAMKVGRKLDKLIIGGIVANPDNLVIARIIVFGKIDVVFPEEVIRD